MTDLERTYREESPRLLNWIRGRIGSSEESEDLMQDVFARASAALDPARPVEDLVSWLYTSARNGVVDAWRRRSRRPEESDLEALEVGPETLVAESVEPGPDEAYMQVLAQETLEEALADLPERQREVFILQAVDGYTFAEIAELLDISINTAMSRKRYAVTRLRTMLQDFKNLSQHEEERHER